MNCYYCGSEIADDENFCARCGKEAKEIKIDYSKLNFGKEKQEQKESEILDNTKADFDTHKKTDDILDSISVDVQTENNELSPATKKDEPEKSVEADIVNNDKSVSKKNKEPIKVVVKRKQQK